MVSFLTPAAFLGSLPLRTGHCDRLCWLVLEVCRGRLRQTASGYRDNWYDLGWETASVFPFTAYQAGIGPRGEGQMESKEEEQGCRKHEVWECGVICSRKRQPHLLCPGKGMQGCSGKEGNNLNNPMDKTKVRWQRWFQLDRIKK